jgi:hypothetical protein
LRVLGVAAIAVVAAGCSVGGGESSPTDARVERCTERFLQRATTGPREEVRRYARVTYCEPFERRGWVYDDGRLNIAAYHRLVEGGTCGMGKPGQPARTVPCEDLEQGFGPRMIDCALLHLVPRSEVRTYLEGLQKSREVQCDDGTPLAELGTR